ncbi:MAG TPA: SDR family oxidoreductase [Thermoanaerobaculia bacterium]|jgi:hypothetical protein|nr:SDR family oxidoreductase [Thermoanaerobaculia bacterium]
MKSLAPPPGGFALVTGASSGIGEALARALAAKGWPLILAARSKGRLDQVAATLRECHQVEARVVEIDLSLSGAAERLFAETEGHGLPVELLVNNAGFGWNGPEEELPLARLHEMLALNVVAQGELAHLVFSAQAARRRGLILNVASTTAFLPTPYFSAYGATKAFVLAFSQALHEEGRPLGITVTCLCPGYTKTGFHDRAEMQGAEATPFPEMTPDAVARVGLDALERGKAFKVPHLLDRVWIAGGRLVPRTWPPKIAARMFARTRLRE